MELSMITTKSCAPSKDGNTRAHHNLYPGEWIWAHQGLGTLMIRPNNQKSNQVLSMTWCREHEKTRLSKIGHGTWTLSTSTTGTLWSKATSTDKLPLDSPIILRLVPLSMEQEVQHLSTLIHRNFSSLPSLWMGGPNDITLEQTTE